YIGARDRDLLASLPYIDGVRIDPFRLHLRITSRRDKRNSGSLQSLKIDWRYLMRYPLSENSREGISLQESHYTRNHRETTKADRQAPLKQTSRPISVADPQSRAKSGTAATWQIDLKEEGDVITTLAEDSSKEALKTTQQDKGKKSHVEPTIEQRFCGYRGEVGGVGTPLIQAAPWPRNPLKKGVFADYGLRKLYYKTIGLAPVEKRLLILDSSHGSFADKFDPHLTQKGHVDFVIEWRLLE
uniref:Uncharacterized protein n=1 Tax=Cannabis sativa TaxID=3483 RepID=A0A803QRF7_CANSA